LTPSNDACSRFSFGVHGFVPNRQTEQARPAVGIDVREVDIRRRIRLVRIDEDTAEKTFVVFSSYAVLCHRSVPLERATTPVTCDCRRLLTLIRR
jgi:hypothetical protein